jgi:polysaccharide deacetylase family protein (PEP-CTERM system associated)
MKYGPPVISIDVEDWPQSTWDRNLPITERAVDNTRRLLSLLEKAGVRATMFVLGKFAERFPHVVREIQIAGHEVACHGYGHVEISSMTPDQFRSDIYRAKDLLEQILGEPIRGYRAPDFSIVKNTLWALDVLAETGFEYDSSIVPVRLVRYGIPDWPTVPIRLRLSSGQMIYEAPLATFSWLGRNWPVGGGGYHRLLPGIVARYLANQVLATAPFVFYCHPYEFDIRELKESPLDLPLFTRLHQGAGRRWFQSRFECFLKRFGGQTMQQLLSAHAWPECHVGQLCRSDSIRPATAFAADRT